MKISRIANELLHYRLSAPVGGSGVASVDVLLTTVELASGASGLGFSYVLAGSGKAALAAADLIAAALAHGPLHHPAATWRQAQALFNRTGKGPNNIALAALDVACWDAYARERGEPLGVALGGAPRAVPVYGSGLYNARQTPAEAREATERHLAAGFKGAKPRVDGSTAAPAVLAAVRDAAGGLDLMCDLNEKATGTQAQRILHSARDLGYLFVEEPLPTSDVAGYAALGRAFPRLAALGEHVQGVAEAMQFLRTDACGAIQPDLAMMGGLTPSLDLARVAEAHGVEVTPHFLPGLFVHLACACPNLTWLEDFPLLEPLFAGWPQMRDGTLAPGAGPGHGLILAEGVRERYRA